MLANATANDSAQFSKLRKASNHLPTNRKQEYDRNDLSSTI